MLDYLAHPVIFAHRGAASWSTVTIHALLGVRSILFDLDLAPWTRRRIERGLWALGVVTVGYGLTLLTTLADAGLNVPPTLDERLAARGVSRRAFLNFCGVMAATLALPASYRTQIAEALALGATVRC